MRRPTTFRVNPLRGDVPSVLARLRQVGIAVQPVAWYPLAFVVRRSPRIRLESLEIYQEGRIYVQSLSSMLPPLALQPRPGEQVLDLAAAPGSKTTQMAAMMEGRGRILAVEASPVRAERLRFNLRRQGADMVEVAVDDGARIGARLAGRFDRALVDAPCSGEGRFQAGQPATYRHWSVRLVERMARLQRRLLAAALRAVRPGGVVVYATCTLNPLENEVVVQWALDRWPQAVAVEPAPLPVGGTWAGLDRLEGRPLHPALRAAVRVPPSSTMEGFFICRLRVRQPVQVAQPSGSVPAGEPAVSGS